MGCGIYKYTNLIDGKMYIGQTIDFAQRKREHRFDAFNKSINNEKSFHAALKKYGEENFSFEIIEECDKTLLDEREKYWIAYYHTYIKDPLCNGYNLTPGGQNGQSDSSKKPVLQYDLEGNFIKKYESVSEASRQLNLEKSNISAACRQETSQCGGYQWKYENDSRKIYKINFIGSQEVEQYDFLGKLLNTYKNAKEASEKTNICHQSITACCRNEVNFAGEYQWKYKNDKNKKIEIKSKQNRKILIQINTEGNIVKIYKSITEASQNSEFSRRSLTRYINTGNIYKGYYWKTYE